jgi:hypothetical protein
MAPAERELAFQIVAANFSKGYAAACRERDESDDWNLDSAAVADEAAIIDPSLLPPVKKARAIEVFGEAKFSLDTGDLHMDIHRHYPVQGAPGIDGIKFTETHGSQSVSTFVEQGAYECPDDDGDDEMVVIRIKTGKGGRQQFRVPKKVAKDMVGCD